AIVVAVERLVTSAASIDRGCGLFLCTNENCIMSDSTVTDHEALAKLFIYLFPEVAHSGGGMALLAAQISGLEERCAVMQSVIDNKPRRSRDAGPIPTAAGKL